MSDTKPVLFKNLTKTEKKHLKESAGCLTLTAFKVTAAFHKKLRDEGAKIEPCYACKNIARRLGLPV